MLDSQSGTGQGQPDVSRPREDIAHPRVQTEETLIPQAQDRGGGDALGHRSDAEGDVNDIGLALHGSHGSDVHQRPRQDQTVGNIGDVLGRPRLRHPRVEQGGRIRDVHTRDVSAGIHPEMAFRPLGSGSARIRGAREEIDYP